MMSHSNPENTTNYKTQQQIKNSQKAWKPIGNRASNPKAQQTNILLPEQTTQIRTHINLRKNNQHNKTICWNNSFKNVCTKCK